jgi:hypothetical protein
MITMSRSYKILLTIDNFPRSTLIRDVRFEIPYVYDYITQSCRKQTEVIQNMKMTMIDKLKPNTENISGLKLVAVIYTTVRVSSLLWSVC